ncbi:Uncharacterized conserved protein [Haloplanus vescus]|uniref:Uncharacterized conserved protein n=1 Tax=Haloplanus vescus TaxID=555874 RepID=A0A1H3YIM5_9EURY|nr:hypothetical protein [Haloplanus vescus]SEA10748.1 Uncharacterized conserved protein [Haloplanus vescus]
MTWGRPAKVAFAVALVASSLAVPMATIGSAQSDSAYVTIGNVSVSPQTPEPGEQITVTAELQNSESSSGAAEISEVALQGPGQARRSTTNDLGDLGPGDAIEVPLSTSFESEGEKRLNIVLRGTSPSGGVFVIERPVYIDVERSSGVSMAFSTVYDDDAAAGAETPVNVTVANGDSEQITGVQLELNGSTVDNPDRIRGSIDGGSQHVFAYDVTFDEVGTQTLRGEVTYTTAEGVTRTATKSVEMTVEEPAVRGDLSAQTTSDGDTEVELTNFGNTGFSDIEVTATADDQVVARNLMGDIDPDSNESVTFDIPSSVDGTVTYTATYTAAGTTHTTTLRDQAAVSGEIRLVSVQSSAAGSGVTIQGDAANLGSTTAESVLVSVPDTEAVSPTSPSGQYYVGEVEGSEFGTFELTASRQSNVSSVPVEITYVVDGDRVTTTQQIDVDSASMGASAAASSGEQNAASRPDEPGGGSGGLPMTAIGAVVALLVVVGVGFGVYRWRNP